MKHYNFLFLMADQIRTATLEGMGDGIQTPNLCRLMDESVLFTRCILHQPALHAQPGITGNGALSQPLRRAHP